MRNYILLLLTLAFFDCNFAIAKTTFNTDGSTDVLSSIICNIVNAASGTVAQAIATLVIIITGYSFFVGKVSIGMLFIVAAGIMFVFGAETIIGWILNNGSFSCKGGKII